jgi:hypothetical protein
MFLKGLATGSWEQVKASLPMFFLFFSFFLVKSLGVTGCRGNHFRLKDSFMSRGAFFCPHGNYCSKAGQISILRCLSDGGVYMSIYDPQGLGACVCAEFLGVSLDLRFQRSSFFLLLLTLLLFLFPSNIRMLGKSFSPICITSLCLQIHHENVQNRMKLEEGSATSNITGTVQTG